MSPCSQYTQTFGMFRQFTAICMVLLLFVHWNGFEINSRCEARSAPCGAFHPGVTSCTHVQVCGSNGLAAMLAVKKSAGVTLEVNLSNLLHKVGKYGIHHGFEIQGRCHQWSVKKDSCPPKCEASVAPTGNFPKIHQIKKPIMVENWVKWTQAWTSRERIGTIGAKNLKREFCDRNVKQRLEDNIAEDCQPVFRKGKKCN